MDMRDQHGNRVGQVDAYGNPIQGQTDAYGNPLTGHEGLGHGTTGHGTGMGTGMGTGTGIGTGLGHQTGGHGPTGYGTGTGTGLGGQPQMTRPEKEHHGVGGILHRSNSSSSSSSEDDGMGGRRKKKGLKDKIKDKLPGTGGGHQTDEYGQQTHATHTGTGTGTAGYGGTTTTTGHQEPEKKGMMEKIKEKLPGGHH